MLGRIQRFRGHLSHAKETFQEVLAANPSGMLRVPIQAEIAEIHLLRDELDEAERTLRTCRNDSTVRGGGGQGWAIALTEVPLALALGTWRARSRSWSAPCTSTSPTRASECVCF